MRATGRETTRRVVVLGILLAPLTAWGQKQADVAIIDSIPKQGETVATPRRLVLHFNAPLEKPRCTVSLVRSDRATILLIRQEPDAPSDSLAYPLPVLNPGAYEVRWRVLTADDRVSEGVLPFAVGPAPAGP